jgi:hypothetical protein
MALSVAKTVQFFNSTEGKDKQLKVIQFAMRALGDIMDRFIGNADLAKRLVSLWKSILVARNITWLGKWLNEYQTCVTLGKQAEEAKTSQIQLITNMTRTCRFFFGLRWAIENIKILGHVGFLPSIDGSPKGPWNKRAKWMWCAALGFGLTAEIMRLQMNTAERNALKMVPSCSSAELWHQTAPPTMDKEAKAEKDKKLAQEQGKSLKQIVAFCGDSVVATHVVTLPEVLGLWQGGYSDLTVGLGGCSAAIIQCTNLWPK